MTDLVFVDSNVLVYSLDVSEPEKQRHAESWLWYLWSNRVGRLSFQVLLEFYVIATKKIDVPLSHEEARTVARSLLSWDPVITDDRTISGAWVIQDRFHVSWWDSLIVSAAQIARCSYLLTEDLQHGQKLGGVEVVNPFRASPPDLFPG
ncbi:MAG TPA: PIN domain-containing protein [Thermoanaerobaculia bacterium]|nr:PIN domain-containing protein [Thermoanaerobaculia bacterium]